MSCEEAGIAAIEPFGSGPSGVTQIVGWDKVDFEVLIRSAPELTYNLSMRKEELDRRCAEMKTRMLAQRDADARGKPVVATKPKSAAKKMQRKVDPSGEADDDANVSTLRKRIAQLEKENERLRSQLAMMSAGSVVPDRSSTDAVREQRHNFFKYSNSRRY
ncbi:MAG: hypothetical protein QM757_13085 [Paludibaculum sp.]